MRDRTSNYRQIRVVISPAREVWYVAVLTRVTRGGMSNDAMIFRTVMPPPGPGTTVAEIVASAARVLSETSGRL